MDHQGTLQSLKRGPSRETLCGQLGELDSSAMWRLGKPGNRAGTATEVASWPATIKTPGPGRRRYRRESATRTAQPTRTPGKPDDRCHARQHHDQAVSLAPGAPIAVKMSQRSAGTPRMSASAPPTGQGHPTLSAGHLRPPSGPKDEGQGKGSRPKGARRTAATGSRYVTGIEIVVPNAAVTNNGRSE
jgi:hypothetical protein